MKLPRDFAGSELAAALAVFGYRITRQTGSHIRVTTVEHGEHHLTIPAHVSLRVGTLSAILGDVAEHFGTTRSAVTKRLFEG